MNDKQKEIVVRIPIWEIDKDCERDIRPADKNCSILKYKE